MRKAPRGATRQTLEAFARIHRGRMGRTNLVGSILACPLDALLVHLLSIAS
jgi:hypothetical protein